MRYRFEYLFTLASKFTSVLGTYHTRIHVYRRIELCLVYVKYIFIYTCWYCLCFKSLQLDLQYFKKGKRLMAVECINAQLPLPEKFKGIKK